MEQRRRNLANCCLLSNTDAGPSEHGAPAWSPRPPAARSPARVRRPWGEGVGRGGRTDCARRLLRSGRTGRRPLGAAHRTAAAGRRPLGGNTLRLGWTGGPAEAGGTSEAGCGESAVVVAARGAVTGCGEAAGWGGGAGGGPGTARLAALGYALRGTRLLLRGVGVGCAPDIPLPARPVRGGPESLAGRIVAALPGCIAAGPVVRGRRMRGGALVRAVQAWSYAMEHN